MSPASIPKRAVAAALVEEWDTLAGLLGELSESEWLTPTALPGWSVKDVAAHVVGTELTLIGQASPPLAEEVRAQPHVRNEIGAINEAWVESFRTLSGSDVVDQLRSVTARRRTELEAMTQEAFDADSWTPAGPGSYGRFMQIRVYDCWIHEQDIRQALGRPGHQSGPCAELSLDEVAGALGYIVGKKAGAPSGASVTIELDGPTRRSLHVSVDGRAAVVPSLAGPATAVVRMPFGLFMAMASGRVPADPTAGEVAIEGDAELGARVVSSLNFTI
ncbi:MAG TPA: maleylpyruvate isomerase family mycothiol-dependent enzyme [Acidimicrobiales bacterium]|nr:maleylpyruvate isomerase family mycothiol-dependent enzyme [Acidimicrobiales bacterium]